MNQISDAEAIFGAIATPLTQDEIKASQKAGDSCLAYEVDWQKRTVTCLLRKHPIDNRNKPVTLVNVE